MEEPGTGPGRGGGGKPEQERGALGPPPPTGAETTKRLEYVGLHER